ncbi:dihydrolipoamide acetyltransferase component of pyruvate dehydrogenase complex [Caldovatus sediminis]|uniref:Dihydrolipoamide acetyltransferase component of pyruvate dehydrogenase complex n=1 Tax=Caldovatus sediminis TaxID=2041189 RepID=A0A8J2ZCI0_9PROT|nr:dihydrolipoamide acetyltransferase family protein [Caldovatus sediminis]GGG36226.1 dihydrolipoamide acetyltransferase component of pyruvate dehydrogenase complex [Caldovatus sediminis]
MSEFRMPSLGADMEAGTLVEWLVRPGARVKRGDVVAVVETAKGAIEIEVFEDGVVRELVVPPGTRVPVGTVLARLDVAAGEAAPAPPPAAPAPAVAAPAEAPAVAAAAPPAPVPAAPPAPAAAIPAGARVRATPAARRRAAALGIALEGLRGTGVEGAIRLADLPAAAAPPPRPARGAFDAKAMRGAIAAAMSRSKREIPHYYLGQTVDLTPALQRLERLNAGRAPAERLLPAAIMLRATALAVAENPALNGFWEEGGFRPGEGVHIGWAVALRGGGLVAPAIRHADRLPLEALMAALRDLVGRARGGGLRGSELTDATITVTSLGDRGAESVLPIIHPPQVAMIGFGRVVERPWVVEGAVVPRRVVSLTLAGDHRATDGHVGGLLLARIEALLRNPEAL